MNTKNKSNETDKRVEPVDTYSKNYIRRQIAMALTIGALIAAASTHITMKDAEREQYKERGRIETVIQHPFEAKRALSHATGDPSCIREQSTIEDSILTQYHRGISVDSLVREYSNKLQ